jgi:hypothetical protein
MKDGCVFISVIRGKGLNEEAAAGLKSGKPGRVNTDVDFFFLVPGQIVRVKK